MIPLRGVFSVLYVVLGAIILVRIAPFGIRLETIGGVVLGAAMIALGILRLRLARRT